MLALPMHCLSFFAAKLPISRLQRDLTDSTVLRNIGVPLAHTLIAIHSTLRGLNKILLNEAALHADLDDNWGGSCRGNSNRFAQRELSKPI